MGFIIQKMYKKTIKLLKYIKDQQIYKLSFIVSWLFLAIVSSYCISLIKLIQNHIIFFYLFCNIMINLTKTLTVVFLLLLIQISTSCRSKPNPYPVLNASFILTASHKYGQKYVYHNPDFGHDYYIVKVWGTSYQAGFAYGYLMQKQIRENIDNLWSYYTALAQQQFKWITKLPPALQPMGRKLAIKLYQNLLLANHYITKRFTHKRFLQEYAGISAGSGIPARQIIEINMIPQYTRAGCSILGAWGKATANGDLLQLRALDWDVHNPMNKFPTLVVYHLTQKGSQSFINAAWAGFVGSITGFNEHTGMSQKVRKQTPVTQNETRIGKPWPYAFRDTLQFTKTIDQSLKALNQTRRTCSIYVGLGSATNKTFRLIEYSHKEFKVYNENNFPFTANHIRMDNVVFMPIHDQSDPCFNSLLSDKYGNYTEEWIVNELAASHGTGDTQMTLWNFRTQQLLFQVSFGKKKAYERPTLRIQMGQYLKA